MKSIAATRTLGFAFLLTLTTLSGRASAQDMPWSVSFDIGGESAVSGDLHSGGRGTVLNLPTIVEARSYDEIYGMPLYWNAALGYAVTPTGELRARVSYTKAEAEALKVGTVAGLDLRAAFDDYKRLAMDFGYRQYMGGSDQMVRPFVGAAAGFANIDTLNSTFSVPAAGVVLRDVKFLESSTVPMFGFSGGVQIKLHARVAVQGGLDLQWHGDIKDVDGLAGTGLEPINDETRRWSLPVTAGLTLRF
jgi:hypothetical protein